MNGAEQEQDGRSGRVRVLRRIAPALAATIGVIAIIEAATRLGLLRRGLDWPWIAMLLVATAVIVAVRSGLVAGLVSVALAVVYSAYTLSRAQAAVFAADSLDPRRSLAVLVVGVPLVLYVGRLRERLQRSWVQERKQRAAAEAARDQARELARREAFLAEASRVLGSSLDLDRTLGAVADLAVPALADGCVIDIRENGSIRRVAHAATDPDQERLLRELGGFVEFPGPVPEFVRRLRRGESVLIPEDAGPRLAEAISDPRAAELLRRLRLRSVILAPLIARGRVLGALSFGSMRRYDQRDVEFVELVAARAAVAIDNAALHEAALESSRAKSGFLAVMSHELRTPLTAVMGYAELLEMGLAGTVNDEQRGQIRKIGENAQRLVELIDEILTFSRMEGERARLRLEPVDLAELIRSTAEPFARRAEEKGLDFTVETPESVVAQTDPAKVEHILRDLLSNSVKFTRSGEITVSLRREDGIAAIEVTDTGVGIEPEVLPQIFEPFWQAESPLTREFGGTGLGLAVAQRLARALGGDISAESTPGEGSTFTVRLPVQAAAPTADHGPESPGGGDGLQSHGGEGDVEAAA